MKIHNAADVKNKGFAAMRASHSDMPAGPPMSVASPMDEKMMMVVSQLRSAVEKIAVPIPENSDTINTIVESQIDNMKAINAVLVKLTEIESNHMKMMGMMHGKKKKWKFTPVRDNRGLIESITVEEL